MPRTVLSALFLSLSVVPALAETPRVVTDIAPVQGLVARVMDGVGAPDVLVPPGASPHGHSLKPSDARALTSADAVFWIGDELSPWLLGSLKELAGDAHVVSLLAAPQTMRLEFREGVVFGGADHDDHGHDDHDHDAHEDHAHDGHGHEEHDHDDHKGHDDHGAHDHDDHAHDQDAHGHDEDAHDAHDHDSHETAHDDHGHGHDDHAHDGVDPHAWLAPENGKQWLALVADELSEIDPANADTYQNNARAGQAEIDAIVAATKADLGEAHGQFVVFHDAYQYFEQSFGLRALGAIALGDASDPSVARIAEMRDAVAGQEVSCVFSEPQFNAGLVDTVADGLDIKAVVIDPLGTEIATGPSFYTDLLSEISAGFKTCLTH
ncbi:periplasmic solute binding protein (plasmid) [Ruegeria sp. TM1040]|uniref:zinc ABC transporter substrate-binding protein n=1 Tax=Ruegeria sp. (strain TM1040) TaxID=292414 RepID=UPI00005544ED|nr:zinc ABC transporter substrate-binding protein [Ruegeria sp. TM1040]ABF62583.1 periplasmic solute binding protein [Ruegeria sp. TM1040]